MLLSLFITSSLPRDVIKISALAGGAGKKERVNHPTQKPIELCNKLISACIPYDIEDDKNIEEHNMPLLVVPFAGSGSECLSAKNLNVNFIGFEINSEYVELCYNRLNI